MRVDKVSKRELRMIGDAFADFEYAAGESGLAGICKGKRAVSDFIYMYSIGAYKAHMLYTTSERHEAFLAMARNDTKIPGVYIRYSIGSFLKNLDVKETIKRLLRFPKMGRSYAEMLKKKKVPYIQVMMVAVTEPYQGQGYMRKLLEIAFEEGRKHNMPVYLNTDAKLKRDKYEHIGMKCVNEQRFSDDIVLYDLVYEPETLRKEWKSEAVLR